MATHDDDYTQLFPLVSAARMISCEGEANYVERREKEGDKGELQENNVRLEREGGRGGRGRVYRHTQLTPLDSSCRERLSLVRFT